MAQEDNNGSAVGEALEVLGMVFVAHHQASEVEQPREEPFNLLAPAVTSQASTSLCATAAAPSGGNHFRASFVPQLLSQRCRTLCLRSTALAPPRQSVPPVLP